jgi:hypothetical protein
LVPFEKSAKVLATQTRLLPDQRVKLTKQSKNVRLGLLHLLATFRLRTVLNSLLEFCKVHTNEPIALAFFLQAFLRRGEVVLPHSVAVHLPFLGVAWRDRQRSFLTDLHVV